MNNPFSLEGKNIIVTGASSGIGACIAITCAGMGANTLISARNEERLLSTFSQMEGENNKIMICDLTKEDEIDIFSNSLPNLDGLILCAGITKTIPVKFISKDAIETIFQTNVFSSMMLVQKLLKLKKINKGASIIFISSISSSFADKGNSIYSASKGALNSFCKVLALEVAARKIRTNCIQPGFVPANSKMLDSGIITAEQLAEDEKNYPLGFGEPSDIANGCLYLLSDASKWVTGSIITIDGGVTLR